MKPVNVTNVCSVDFKTFVESLYHKHNKEKVEWIIDAFLTPQKSLLCMIKKFPHIANICKMCLTKGIFITHKVIFDSSW